MNEYTEIVIETYKPMSTAGMHGEIHARPLPGQAPFLPEFNVSCSKYIKDFTEIYPIGSQFKIKAKITCRNGSEKKYIYTYPKWVMIELPFE
jgi:hypothetical protein